MTLADCSWRQAPEILEIFNQAILTSTALYDYEPRTLAAMERWFETKQAGNFPIPGIFAPDGSLQGFGSYGPFRSWPANKYSIEHSLYVRPDCRGRGLGRRLLTALIENARRQDYHMMVGAIDSANTASRNLHRSLGFSHCGSIKQAAFKFGHWLDLEFYQILLPGPATPIER